MKRKILIFLSFLMFFLSSCKTQDDSLHIESVTCFMEDIAEEEADTRTLQRKLAAWYNLNLNVDDPDPGFRNAYNSILYYPGGVMGYVVFPDQSLRIPIGHGVCESGFSHDPNSSFPIGGEGNLTVLYTEQPMELKEGDRFYIYILGDTLLYSVGEQGEDRCALVCGENRYDAARVVED